jgi:hypothetical protein
MANEETAIHPAALRRTDGNSLLRMYHAARARGAAAVSPPPRAKADQAVERIDEELRRRQIPH